jgi:hypothetical protein
LYLRDCPAREQCGRVDLDRMALAAIGGQAVKARPQQEAAGRRIAAQQRQREPGSGVLHAGVLSVDRDMGDADVVIDRGVAGIDGVELGGGVIGAPPGLAAPCRDVGGCGCHQRDPGTLKRLAQRLKRNRVVLRPNIRRLVSERG